LERLVLVTTPSTLKRADILGVREEGFSKAPEGDPVARFFLPLNLKRYFKCSFEYAEKFKFEIHSSM
jgi:hypothetical protein